MSLDSVYNYSHCESNNLLYLDKWQHYPIPFDDIDTDKLFEQASTLFPQLLIDEDDEDATIPLNALTLSAKAYKSRRTLKDKTWIDLGLEKFTDGFSPVDLDRTILPPLFDRDTGLPLETEKVGDKLRGDTLGSFDKNPINALNSRGNKNSSNALISSFLSNGYAANHSNSHYNPILSPDLADSLLYHGGDFTINSNDFSHNTFLNLRSSSHNQHRQLSSGSNIHHQIPSGSQHRQISSGSHIHQIPTGSHNHLQIPTGSQVSGQNQHQVPSSSSNLAQSLTIPPVMQTPRMRQRQASSDKNFQTPVSRIMR